MEKRRRIQGDDHPRILSKRLDSSSETAPSSSSMFSSFQHTSPVYPQTMSDPSFDPSQLSFSSNATQQYQYPSPPTYNPSQQYQSMQYPTPSGYDNQSMSDAQTEFGFGNFDEN